jgi:DNA repair protein RadC
MAIPSEEDMLCTNRIKESAKLLGFHFVDHIIIGDAENYYSFAETNTL